MTVLALLQARDEERFLPGWLANVERVVDGIIALDDGSRDTTAELLAAHPKTIEVIRNSPGAGWSERRNHITLLKAARRHGSAWVLCLDADERVERSFGDDLPHLTEAAEASGIQAYSLRLRELWQDRRHYRVDGVWGFKTRYRFFRNDPGHNRFDPRFFHRTWMPLEIALNLDRVGAALDHNLYHLRMIREVDRRARWARYVALDPHCRYQRDGYDYLLDESGLRLEEIPAGRDFVPFDDPAAICEGSEDCALR